MTGWIQAPGLSVASPALKVFFVGHEQGSVFAFDFVLENFVRMITLTVAGIYASTPR